MTHTNPTGELPEDLAVRVMRIYGEDPKSDMANLVRASDATPAQLGSVIARWAFSDTWHRRMGLWTHDQIRHVVEQYFTPDESPAVDPVAESAQRAYDERDPFARELALRAPSAVTTLRSAGPDVGA